MPRYYLNIRNKISFTPDEEGCDLPNAEAARKEAVRGARSLMSAEIADEGRLDLRGRIEVVDETGELVLIVPFREALEIVENDRMPVRGDRPA
jgi:uncharacterized protein DUF6894